MENYKVFLFDLDGTITDSGLGITNSVKYALKKCGIPLKDETQLYKFIGPPLVQSFENYCDFSEEEAKKAVSYFREYYSDKGMFENMVYDGVIDLLNSLREAGKTIILATAKVEIFAKQIIEHFGLSKYFAFIAGSNMDCTRVHKDEVIRYALEACNITDYPSVVMIGDREHDIIGARKVSIDSIGVLYGYGSKEELTNAKATHIVSTVSEIKSFI